MKLFVSVQIKIKNQITSTETETDLLQECGAPDLRISYQLDQ